MKTTGLPRLVVATVILLASGLALVGYDAFRKDVAAMQAASQEDITWTAYQLEQELDSFMDALSRFQINDSDVVARDVNGRFDILWSRIAVFQQGRVGERLAEYDSDTQIIPDLFDQVKAVDRRVVNLAATDRAEAAALYSEFAQYSQKLREFSRLVSQGEEARGREIREQLQSGVNRTLLFGGLAIVIALTALAYINRESSRFRKLATTNLELADVAERASRVKSQFLSMMSHELRTPMNGVLGLLALAKESAVQPSQVRLIEQAERSGQQMVVLLADILDFSALQSDDLILDIKPFEVERLASILREHFVPQAKLAGISFDISVAPDCSKRFLGDSRRLRQAFGHLALYVVETAGVQNMAMNFSCKNDVLNVSLSFDYLSEGGEWTPDLILGDEEHSNDAFASDALGPAISRGFIEAMNGTLRVDSSGSEQVRIIASIPVEEYSVVAVNVAVVSGAPTMAAICKAALSSESIKFPESGDQDKVHFVLVESGHSSEADFVKHAQKDFPDALLIALGEPEISEPFDSTIKIPLNFERLRNVILRKVV